MTDRTRVTHRAWLLATCTACLFSSVVKAADASGSTSTAVEEIVVTATNTTRSAVTLGATEMQKILPGINPLKAVQTLPGVLFETADPWGNNEQNETLYVHGFSLQQLGYTFDSVPLGDQQYGNYNGLSPSRSVSSENVSKVVLSSGAGDLATASVSNLGGTIATESRDPQARRGGTLGVSAGSYDTIRTFARLETGTFGDGNSAYVSYLHQDARAWDFNGHQRDNQANLKFVHDGVHGKLTAFVDYDTKVEPNEDSSNYDAADPNPPYTRPFIYPNIQGCLSYLTATGAPPAAAGNNFTNCFSEAQRYDVLAYLKYQWHVTSNLDWTNQVYYHNDFGRGVVAGPVNQAGLPGLFNTYYPGQNLVAVFGGTGYAVRTTEYLIDRGGGISTLDWNIGRHRIEASVWYEHDHDTQTRVWYPFLQTSRDLSPYTVPTNPNFTQYRGVLDVDDVVLHLQDEWRIRDNLRFQAGFKSSLQYAYGAFPINQKNLPAVAGTNAFVQYPTGRMNTAKSFLPQVGATWDVTHSEQLFFNVQNNVRQFIPYGAGGSAWSLATQAAFNLFKTTVKPETSWTYEVGLRENRELALGPITGIQGQVNYYHVDFSNRLLSISSAPFILALVAGPAILTNVGSVQTDGVDLAATVHLGSHISVYDAVSYNRSIYADNYTSGVTVVPTAGKDVPGDPRWLNKFVVSGNYGPFEAQVTGDFVGKRFATYTNDRSVPSYFMTGLEASYRLPFSGRGFIQGAKFSVNVTNLGDIKGVSTVVVGNAAVNYGVFPIPPRMIFGTLTADF